MRLTILVSSGAQRSFDCERYKSGFALFYCFLACRCALPTSRILARDPY